MQRALKKALNKTLPGNMLAWTTDTGKYFDYATPINKIQSIVNKGPNMNMKSDDMKQSQPHYLSTRWYFAGNEDAYNP